VLKRFDAIRLKRVEEKIQGPYLAKIEFSAQCNQVEKVKESLRDYIDTFACKPGFIYDLEYFNQIIRNLNCADFVLNEVLEPLFEANKPPFKSIKSIYTCLSYFQFKRCYLPLSAYKDDSKLLESMYLEAFESFGRDLLPTAYQYADEFLILSIFNRLDFAATYSDSFLLQLISNLKLGLVNSPSNHQLKLLLINFYSHLGAYDAMQLIYDSMEIKNIQNYSLSYLMLTQNLR
jgi:hypothetical protein